MRKVVFFFLVIFSLAVYAERPKMDGLENLIGVWISEELQPEDVASKIIITSASDYDVSSLTMYNADGEKTEPLRWSIFTIEDGNGSVIALWDLTMIPPWRYHEFPIRFSNSLESKPKWFEIIIDEAVIRFYQQ